MAKLTTICATLLFWVTLVAARGDRASQQPAVDAVAGGVTSQGCYASLPAAVLGQREIFLSVGLCSNRCMDRRKPVAIMHLDFCFCADTYPPRHSLVDDALCDLPCPGYPFDACGGQTPDAYSVYNTGLKTDIENDNDNDDADESSPSPTDVANDHHHCHSILTTINEAADSVFSAAKDFAKTVQVFIGRALGRTDSDHADESSEELPILQEAEDLKI